MNKEFYIVPEEVFRVGNSTTPRLHMVKADEVDIMVVNGIKMVIANGRGVSLFTKKGLEETDLTGWVWKFRANTPIPTELKLVNDKPEHYCVAPKQNMPADLYKGLLEKMGLAAEKVWKKRA